MKFNVAVPAPLVLKEAAAEGTFERQLVTVDLLMALQVAQTAEDRSHSQRLIIQKGKTFYGDYEPFKVH